MPGFDRTGPRGQGPATGRGLGPCGSGMGFRRGFGRGFGMGMGRGLGRAMPMEPVTLTKEEQKKILEEEKKFIQERLKAVEKKLKEMV